MENSSPQTDSTTTLTAATNILKECSNCMDRISSENETRQTENTTTDEKNKTNTEKVQPEPSKPQNQENNDIELLKAIQPKGSLQESFEKFRKKRMEKFKYKKYLKEIKEKDRNSQEFKDELRRKFVETAKKYFGVPYAKRYLQPGEPGYDSPLFLDCCGLVRQVVYDLREDFGFSLQRWNQAYQYDTLPIDLKFEEMKPGDLIFWSGTYYDQKKKKQKHDMVHVEIFIGGPTGEQTIGARWTKGVVQVFDTYKFVSKSYYDIKYYYKSIDTWLSGICQSHCPEHPWRDDRDLWVADKYSVFALGEEAGDEECEEGEAPEETKKEGEEVKVDKTEKKAKVNRGPKQVYVGKGNNDKLIKDYFSTHEGYVIMDQKHAFSTKFDVKWVQTTSEIDYLSLKEGQIVNHIPNINLITNKKNLLQTLRNYEEVGDAAKESELKLADIMPPTFQLDKLTDEILFINHPSEGIWISKPQNHNQGKGLKLIRDIRAFKKDFIESKKFYLGEFATNEVFGKLAETKEKIKENQSDEFRNIGNNTIIQKYIENPLLLNKRKFDIRCYALIASTKPFLVLYADEYIRLSLKEYNPDVQEFDKVMHLTNNAIQKKCPGYSEMKEDSIWSMARFSEYLEKELNIRKEKQEAVSAKIKKIITHVIKSAEKKLDKRVGFLELLGFDIMIDDNLNPYLLEVNTNPALFLDTKVQAEVIPKIVHKTLDIALALNKEPEKVAEAVQSLLQEKEKLEPFEVIYNSANV